jgi:hypothetical protein
MHFKYNAVAAVVGHIHVKKAIGIAGDHPEIKLPEAVEGFYQLGKMYIFGEREIHSVQFSLIKRASTMRKLYKEMLIFSYKIFVPAESLVYNLLIFENKQNG